MRWIDIISEGRDAPLYHGTSVKNFFRILQSGKLTGKPARIHAVTKKEYIEVVGISLTRDKFLRYSTERFGGGAGGRLTAPIIIQFNQTAVAQDFKIVPQHAAPGFDWHRRSNNSESEELVVAPQGLPINSKYVTCVLVIEAFYNIYEKNVSIEELALECKKHNVDIKIIKDPTAKSKDLVKHR